MKNKIKKKESHDNRGYSLYEVLIVLLILGVTTAIVLPGEISGRAGFQEQAFARECQDVYYQILQYQNDAMMDGRRRQLRYFNWGIYSTWTKNGELHKEIIPSENILFSWRFPGPNRLSLYASGTISKGGTLVMTNIKNEQQVKKIVFQIGNGRIYLEE